MMKRIQMLAAIGFSFAMLGFDGCPKPGDGSHDFTGPDYQVLSGEHIRILNPITSAPCSGADLLGGLGPDGWYPGDSFQFIGGGISYLPVGVTLSVMIDENGSPLRELVANANPEPVFHFPVFFSYWNGVTRPFLNCQGDIFISTVLPLQVSATARQPNPTPPGQPVLLQAVVSGGVPPFHFAWSPSDSLDNPASATPVAKPTTTTTYRVTVTDSNVAPGDTTASSRSPHPTQAFAEVPVTVSGSSSYTLTVIDPNIEQFVTSNPSGIGCFNGSGCSASFAAGSKVTLTVEDNSAAWSGCSPVGLTQCTVTMDSDRTVTVLPKLQVVSISAIPSPISLGNSSQLRTTVTGGMSPYTFSWTPSDSLDNPTSDAPVAKPAATTLYSVQVTDAAGQHVGASVTVVVQ